MSASYCVGCDEMQSEQTAMPSNEYAHVSPNAFLNEDCSIYASEQPHVVTGTYTEAQGCIETQLPVVESDSFVDPRCIDTAQMAEISHPGDEHSIAQNIQTTVQNTRPVQRNIQPVLQKRKRGRPLKHPRPYDEHKSPSKSARNGDVEGGLPQIHIISTIYGDGIQEYRPNCPPKPGFVDGQGYVKYAPKDSQCDSVGGIYDYHVGTTLAPNHTIASADDIPGSSFFLSMDKIDGKMLSTKVAPFHGKSPRAKVGAKLNRPFIAFYNSVHHAVRQENPLIGNRALVGLIAERWAGLTEEEKKGYTGTQKDSGGIQFFDSTSEIIYKYGQ